MQLHAIKNKIQPVNNEEELVTCKNWKMTTLASVFQAKLVSQMMIKTDQKNLKFSMEHNSVTTF